MATKKQKREAGEKRRQEFLAIERARGLEAQRKDREYREKKKQKALDGEDKKPQSSTKIEFSHQDAIKESK